MPPTVSVIIPTYNYAAFLPQAIESALKQASSYLEVQVVVVDDGSTDDTTSVLERFSDHIVSISQTNAGLSAARNRGLTEACGKYLTFLDADDILGNGALLAQLEFLKAHPKYDVAVCRNTLFSHMDDDGNIVKTGRWNLFADSLDVHLCHFNIAPPHAFMMRRESAGDLIFDSSLRACEDHWFWFSLLARGGVFGSNPNGTVHYRRHPQSMSANLAEQWRYDAELHKRIYRMLSSAKGGEFTFSGEHFLACSVGALWTQERIRPLLPEIADSLLRLSTQALTTAMELGINKGRLTEWLAARGYIAAIKNEMNSELLSDFQSLLPELTDLKTLEASLPAMQRGLHL